MTSQAAALAAYQADADLTTARQRLGAALPSQGWLSDYLRAVTPLTDAPVEFSLASGLCAISSAIGNSLWYDTWGQTVYPHLWAVLVAPSSFWRKSTAINMAEKLLREAEDSRVLPADFSREKMLEELSARPVGMLTQREFGGFLERLGSTYMAGTKEMLTDLYDGPERYSRALKTKTYVIERPAITLLAATTLDWLESKITDGDLRSGFLARFLFITAATKSSPKGLTGGMDYAARMMLRDALIDLTKITPGPVTLTPDAMQLYDAWLGSWQEEVESVRHASDLTGFAVRLQTYALKLSMSYQASSVMATGNPVDVIDVDSIRSAIAYCRHLWENVASLVDEEIAIGKDARELRRMRHMVGGGITRSQLLKLSRLKARDFDEYLKTLVQSGELISESRLASELGLEREKDRRIEWLRPAALSSRLSSREAVSTADSVPAFGSQGGRELNQNGELRDAPIQFTRPGELREGTESADSVLSSHDLRNRESELRGADLSTESDSVLSSSLSPSDESGGDTRAREEPKRKRGPKTDSTGGVEWA